MNVLIIGGGGREHALAWKVAQSPRVAKVFVAPGNAGTAREPELTNVAITAIPELVAFAASESGNVLMKLDHQTALITPGISALRFCPLQVLELNELAFATTQLARLF